MTEIKGIDVSHYQGSIDWDAVAQSGVKFAYLKATEGFSWHDSRFRSNWRAAKASGIIVGAYHFFRSKNGLRQANNLLGRLNEVQFQNGDLLPVIDIETWDPQAASKSTYISYIEQWSEKAFAEIGKKPVIYTQASFWRRIGSPNQFSDHPLWVVDISARTNPRMPVGWNDYAVRQFDHHGSVAGIDGDVDLNSLNGTSLSPLQL